MTIFNEIAKLEAIFRELKEFKVLQETVEEVKKDEEARTLFTNFRNIQQKLQQKQMAGEELLEDEYVYLQKTAQLAQQNVKILAMLEAEMAMSTVIEEVNRMLVEPIQSLYEGI